MKKFVIIVLLLLAAGGAFVVLKMQQNVKMHGVVIDPPRPVTHMILMDYEHRAYAIDLLKNNWSYLIFADSECGDICKEQIDLTAALVKTSGAPQNLQRILIMGYEPDKAFIDELKSKHADLKIAVLTRAIWSIFTVQFQLIMQQIGEMPFLLISPQGMMRAGYDELVQPAQLVADLGNLLLEEKKPR